MHHNKASLINEAMLDSMLASMDEAEKSEGLVTFGHTVTLRAIIDLARAEVKRRHQVKAEATK